MIKRWRPVRAARSAQIRKRTCHITLTLVPGVDRYGHSAPEPSRRRGEAEARADAARPLRRPRPSPEEPAAKKDRPRGRSRSRRRRQSRRPRRPRPKKKTTDRKKKTEERRLMGQKVHPGGMRVGVIHDWKSNWYTGTKEFPRGAARGHQDPRAHLQQAFARGPLRRAHPQGQAADHDRHLHRAPGNRDRQVRCRGGRAPQRDPRHDAQERAHQHQRDQAPRARREARRAVDRRAAPEPRQLPARDEALARLGDALGRARREGAVRRPARRDRDEPLRELLRGPRAAAHDPRRHRLRLRRGEDDLRPHRRQGLDQQGRDHARGLRERRPAEGDAARRPGHRAPPRRPHGGPLRVSRERPEQGRRPRGPRPRAEAATQARRAAAVPAARRARPEEAAGGGRGRGGGRRPSARARPAGEALRWSATAAEAPAAEEPGPEAKPKKKPKKDEES